MAELNHISINVLDLEKSLNFYQKALGLSVIREIVPPDGSFKLIFLGDGVTGASLELTWLKDRNKPYDLGECEYHIGFLTDKYDELHKLHQEMGVICQENSAMGIYFIEDPDGYWLEIIPKR